MSGVVRTAALVAIAVASVVAVGVAGGTAAQSGGTSHVHGPHGVSTLSFQADSTPGSADASGTNTTIETGGSQLQLENTSGQVVRGTTGLPAGSELTVAVGADDEMNPFLNTAGTTVSDDGHFEAALNLTVFPPDTDVNVSVFHNGTRLARVDGLVVRCVEHCESQPSEWPVLDQGVVRATSGETVAIPITIPDDADERVNVTIGDAADANYEVHATVADGDGDGTVVLTLDTGSAGSGETTTALSVGEGDDLVTAERVTEPVDGALDPAEYALELGPADAPYDVGTLILTAGASSNERPEGSDDGDDELPETTGEVTFITAGDSLELGNAPAQAIHAETTLEAGETVHLQVRSTNPYSPFLRGADANVTDTGTITAVVDLRNVSPDSSFEVLARHDGEMVGATAGRVVAGINRTVNDVGAGGGNGSAGTPSNVVVADGSNGSIPIVAIGAVGIGGVLSLFGVARFTGLLRR